MSKLKKPYYLKTEVGVGITISKIGRKGRVLTFSTPITHIQLSEYEANSISQHLNTQKCKDD